ncbi:MAG: D-alanyl-D-alanine carboxypeptidase [Deltaproteobacteria bacterium]|nr:D-alanyl-D-alanine carboxypeptidase [Deltaproteobacteria bacterium]
MCKAHAVEVGLATEVEKEKIEGTRSGAGFVGGNIAGGVLGRSLKELEAFIGPKDAVMVADSTGRVLLEKNAERPLVPASILKIFTSLVAIHHLGFDYRFATDFYLDKGSNLIIKGYGDPLLISETVGEIASRLATISGRVKDIVLDDSYFAQSLEIPGVSSSSRPYDAPNGALCVNFNTVFFKKKNNVFVSAEPETPLLPIALERVRRSGLNRGRIVLSHDENLVTLYAGGLFQYFLRQAGVEVNGEVRLGTVQPATDRLVYRHHSIFTLRDIIAKLLDHSNNFATNQILITSGVKAFGTPGTMEKGVRTARAYARDILGLTKIRISEGSGISRDNQISARDMLRVLEVFSPHRFLLRNQGLRYYKTGTLRDVSTRAGYTENRSGLIHRFVVMINTPGKSAELVTDKLFARLE